MNDDFLVSQEKTTLDRISMSASKHVSHAKGTNQRNGGRQAKCFKDDAKLWMSAEMMGSRTGTDEIKLQ